MQQLCKHCLQAFEITPADLAFYEKVSPVFNGKKELIPPPTLCPECREQRRMAWRNERHLYHRKCGLTGKQIISVYSPDKDFRVYDQHIWWEDSWDPKQYGRTFDFKRPFFEQFKELLHDVPRLGVTNSNNVNCDYTTYTNYSKDCYLIFGNNDTEKCCYGWRMHHSFSCFDCSQLNRCKYCYECSDCDDSYELFWSHGCQNCSNASYLISCRGCKDCMYCIGLQQKQYCVLNTQYTKEEYEKMKHTLQDDARAKQEYSDLILRTPRRATHTVQCDDCIGDYLVKCKGCHLVFSAEAAEDCSHVYLAENAKDCSDCTIVGWPGELCYEGTSVGVNSYANAFCSLCWSCTHTYYCDSCFHSNNLFGCTGLKKSAYCVLNMQYTKEEYEALVPKIVEHMRNTPLRSCDGSYAGQEWGEFFPLELSPFSYNETIADESFPLQKNEVQTRGWGWHDMEQTQDHYIGPAIHIPHISQVPDDITKQILTCEITGKPYKIIPQELKFYREMNIPIPRKCPDQRHKERMALRNPRKLWSRQCAKCQKDIQTTYAPERPEIVYCESCYLKTVY